MPVKRRQSRRRQRREWEYQHHVALGSGCRYFGAFCMNERDQFGPWDMDEAREAWADVGEQVMEHYRVNRPTLRPWGWWVFGPPQQEPPAGRGSQRLWLRDHGYLMPAELEMLKVDPALLKNPW